VKLNFDREGTEPGYSYLWLRMAKPYAGETLGWHTPLIDGTEVAIAYSNGDIDLPYIACALHDSGHPDHVTRDNHTRNVLRTPANNKLRMEDKRGEEHIKLATEYGKTQLSSGHLVDSKGQLRGKGTELRTDEWGTLRAGKGLFVAADAQAKAQGEALDRDAALKEIDRLNQQLQQLEMAAEKAQALKADVDSQIEMFEQRLKPLNESLLFSAPEGMALTSGEHLQMSAAKNVAVNAGGDISVGTMGNLTALAGEKLGLFARTGQLSLKSGEGPVDVQAQNASMRLFAEKKLTLSSASDISFAGKKRITLIGGGSYLRLEAGKVEYGTTASYMRKVKRSFKGTAQEMPMTVQKKTAPVTLKSQDLDSSSLPLPQKNSAEMIKSSGTASQNESYASAMVNPAESPDKKKLGSVKRYLYSPFTFDTNVLLYDSLAKFIDSENDYYIVFVSEKQKEQFYNQLNEEEELIKEITLVKMNESGRTHSMNEVEHYYKEFKTFHMSYEKYHFEPGDNATIVHVLGHGDAGDDGLAPSPYAKLRSYKYPLEIIPQMKKMQLPIDAIIKLDFCWSGAGKRPEGNTADELTQAFHLGRITELVQGEEPCFLDAFIGEFNEYFPEFVGEVHGYIGTVLTYRKNIMNEKVNTGKPHFSVAVAPDEGADELFFRKSDMRIIRKV